MTSEIQEMKVAPDVDKHQVAMERYRALDLQIDHSGVVQLTSDAHRRLFAYGYFSDGHCPKTITSWKLCAEGIELLQGMGVPALHNLELLYVVNGKLTAMHRLCLAACQATGQMLKHHVIYVDKDNQPLNEKNVVGFQAEACVVYVRRQGQENDAIGAFTMADAKAAGLIARNKNWQAYGRDMLFHRASYRALSQQFSDVLGGVRCKEIMQDLEPMVDEGGRPLTAADGQQLYQRRLARQQQSQEAFEALKK